MRRPLETRTGTSLEFAPVGGRVMKVLVSAYACNPEEGSEPQTGWSVASGLHEIGHDVWVLTRANNRNAIERALADGQEQKTAAGIEFIYVDLPGWVLAVKHRIGMLRTYYLLWQVWAYFAAKHASRNAHWDVALHITFGSCWLPTSVSWLPVPFVWGPVGGGEAIPRAFIRDLGIRGALYEALRVAARWWGRRNPLIRQSARKSGIALGTTCETVGELRALGCREVSLLPRMSLPDGLITELGDLPPAPERPIRFLCVGRLLDWKGFHLAVRAFALAAIPDSELWVVGDGPARARLARLARKLGVGGRVRFLGKLTHQATLRTYGEVHALVHPSLHDSGSWVATESMAAGRPVVCLNLGGPGVIVSSESGFRIEAREPRQTVRDMAGAMIVLADDPDMRRGMGEAGRQRVRSEFRRTVRGRRISEALEASVRW